MWIEESSRGAGATASLEEDAGPAPFHADGVLRDGSTVRIQPARPCDEPALLAFLDGLSGETRSLRFFGALGGDSLRREVRWLARPGGGSSFALVATHGSPERVIGHAMCSALDADRAEIAFVVADEWQGRGLATLLLGHIARTASARGIRMLEARVLPHNHAMLKVFRESGFPVSIDPAPGEIRVELPTEPTAEAVERFEQREWTAAIDAVGRLLRPRTVAVIGASRRRGSIGGELLHNLLRFGFQGPVLPVNPGSGVVQSILAYPGVEDVPGSVDLAVIVVPAASVLEVAEACGRKGVRSLVVISAGFGEAGEGGRERQEALLSICREHGMRLVGPNCMGILNTDPAVRLNATFAPTTPTRGRVGFMSQSGALGLAVMEHAGALGLGLSSFVSVGNKADLSGNDLLRYWEQDPDTDLILLYLESFGNPLKFSRIARRVARDKPIIAVKSGRSPAGARATGSHTGSLIAASDVTVDALFRDCGVIRTDTLEQMFDVAALLSAQPAPRGRRTAILTNAGGPGILCADTCEAEGLEIPILAEATQARLRSLLASEASVANPVDMIASASPEQFREAIRVIGSDPGVDALIVIFVPPLVTRPQDAALAIVEGVRSLERDIPVLTVFMQARGVPEELRSGEVRLPSYAFPEDAAIALARAARYGEWRARPAEPAVRFEDARRDEAAAIVSAALGRGGGWLEPDEIRDLLRCYGLPVLDQRVVATGEDAVRAARELGGEVALKAIAPGLVHRSEAGAVSLGLNAEQVLPAARAMEARLREAGAPPTGFLVQSMARRGVEMIVGSVHDRQFGPVVACGAGGVMVELLKDVSVRLAPLARRGAEEMVGELKMFPLLTGYRGGPVYDVPALTDAVLRVSALVEDLPQIAELDLNPILIHPDGVTVVDARARAEPARPSGALGRRA